MARLTDVQRSVMAQGWDLAVFAANNGYTSSNLISAASSLARDAGLSLAFAESSAMAVLYGYARRMAVAAGVFQAAPPAAVIEPSMIATPPWARDEQVMNTAPIWHATFQMTFLDAAGNITTEFRTSVFEITLPETVGELTAAILADAEAMAAKYKVTLLSVDPHQLLAV